MISRDFPIDRRLFIGGIGATLVGGCVTCPEDLSAPRAAGTLDLSDVHAHFFNMSDLPVGGFIEHVLVPNRAPRLIGLAAALGDLGRFLKLFSPTVAREGRGLYFEFAEIPEHHISADRYARMVAERINARAEAAPIAAGFTGDGPVFAPELTLSESYGALAVVLTGGTTSFAPSGEGRVIPPTVSPSDIETILAGDVAVLSSALLASDEPCAMRTVSCPDSASSGCAAESCEEPDASLDLQWARIKALAKWLWEIMQGRCNHVRDYLARTRTDVDGEIWRPHLVVHHLVDYDRWIGDGPASASSHDAQIAFWTEFARARARELRLVTFGGYDPLKHAEERLAGRPSQFDRLQRYFLASAGAPRKIDGFKLYPPMGFKPFGNERCDYAGRDRARGIVSSRWARERYLIGHDIGEEINRSLADFYRFCIDHRAPVLSHAISGNQAACCFGQRANPSHWADLFERHAEYRELRLCLGHIVNDARCFIHAVEGLRLAPPRPAPDHVWALHGTARLLQMSRVGQADVFADIGYLSEVLVDRGTAVAFFEALKWFCEQYDPDCRRILFGTDWIMIGQEIGYEHYVERIRQGMIGANWPEQWQRNLLRDNLREFLRIV